ncbi:MAG: DUF58 domain-containing protein [Planctomycetota bacterium]|nr:MAG: DUF58 domain-containing protein [Planctomycetota bacterium]
MMNSSLYSEYIDLELLSRLPSLEIQAKFLVAGFLNGLHRSPYKGYNVEFKEYRAYQPGDEPKLIDWKAYARSDRLNVKLHEEETNLQTFLLVDRSKSMDYKSERAYFSKWEYARALTAALTMFLFKQKDAVGMGIIDGGTFNFMKPSLKLSHYRLMMSALHKKPQGGKCSMTGGLSILKNLVKPRSIIILFSDFYEDLDKLEKALNYFSFKHCEVLLFHILDPVEADFKFEDPLLLQELEGGEKLTLSPDLIRKDYLKAMNAHKDKLKKIVHQIRGDFIEITSETPPLEILSAYLAKRKGMM